jgi:hypothetical protein
MIAIMNEVVFVKILKVANVGSNEGGNDWNDETIIQVKRSIKHPDYNSAIHSNDIGLIELVDEIKFDRKFIHPACLPIDDLENQKIIIITGFGYTIRGDRSSVADWMQKANITEQPQSKCANKYSPYLNQGLLEFTEKQFCATATNPSTGKTIDTCRGML